MLGTLKHFKILANVLFVALTIKIGFSLSHIINQEEQLIKKRDNEGNRLFFSKNSLNLINTVIDLGLKQIINKNSYLTFQVVNLSLWILNLLLVLLIALAIRSKLFIKIGAM